MTDFCVIDTCINARAAGFEEVYIVFDAARAVHIHGIGAHGTGFTTEPAEVCAYAVTARGCIGRLKSAPAQAE